MEVEEGLNTLEVVEEDLIFQLKFVDLLATVINQDPEEVSLWLSMIWIPDLDLPLL